MRKGFRVNARCWVLVLGWVGGSGVWGAEVGLREEGEAKKGAVEVQAGGWREDFARMGFEVPVERMEEGEIVGQKWLMGGGRPGFLGAKVFFLVQGEPKNVAEVILHFDPTNGQTLGWTEGGSVKVFQEFARPPGGATWGRFREAVGKLPFDTLLSVEGQRVGKYHLQAEQIEKISREKGEGWVSVLEGIMQIYHRGGWKENGKVPAGQESMVDFDEELREVLQENGPVRNEFRQILTVVAMGGRHEKGKVAVADYWQLLEVDKSPAVALGCTAARAGAGGRWEVADMAYWVSNGYFGSISLYGIWPYGAGRSLVCRVDVVQTDPSQLAQATARMVGEGMFMREVRRACGEIKSRIKP